MGILDRYIDDFRKLTGFPVVVHAYISNFFLLIQNEKTEEMVSPDLQYLGTVFPCCKNSDRDYCVRHCAKELHERIIREHPEYLLTRCRMGFLKLAVPVYRNGSLVAVMITGLWKRPLDRESIRLMISQFPLFAEGFTVRAGLLKRTDQSAIYSDIKLYIESRYQQPVRVSHLAKHLSLSVSQTCNIVKKTFGTSFAKLLTNERICRAKIMLATRDELRINEIAELCGFVHMEHFSRMFRRETGTTPKAYRTQKHDDIVHIHIPVSGSRGK